VPSPPGGGSLANVACDDNALGAQSRVRVPLAPGSTYLVQAGGVNGATGTLHLHAQCDPACPPQNDDVANALAIATYNMPWLDTRLTDGATGEAGEPSPCGGIGATVWYRFSSAQDVTVALDTAGSSFDTVLAVYRQDGWVPSPPGGLSPVQCVDNAGGALASKLTFAAKGGASYLVQAGGAHGATGSLQISADCVPACPPQIDNLGAGFLYLPMAESWRTAGATTQPGEASPCGGIGKTVWYLYGVSQDTQRIAIDTEGSDFDTVIALYAAPNDGALDDVAKFQPLQCVDRARDGSERLTFDAKPDAYYAVQIGGHNGASGNLQVQADCDPSPCPPPNDKFGSAFDFQAPWGLPSGWGGDVTGATMEAGEPAGCGGMSHSTWYRFSGWGAGSIAVDAGGSDIPVALALYDAPEVASFSQLHAIDCTSTNTGGARLTWKSQPGHVYYVQAGGEDGAGGFIFVDARCEGGCPPPNDSFASPTYIAAGSVSADISGATLEAGEPQPCGAITGSVWWLIPANGEPIHISTDGSNFSAIMAAYVIDGVSPPPGSLRNIACQHGSATAPELDLPAASPGTQYWVQVGGWGGVLGTLQFSVNCPDQCTVAAPIQGQAGAITGPNTGSGGYLPGARR
jgi:hypothetical protein